MSLKIDFITISSGFQNNTVKKRRFLRHFTLNRQEKSAELKLFNQNMCEKGLTVKFHVIEKLISCISVRIIFLIFMLLLFKSFWDDVRF